MDDHGLGGNPAWTPVALLALEQLERLGAVGSKHATAAGDVLFAAGDASYDFFVVLDGSADIVERLGEVTERVVASYGPGEFLGEIGMLTGERSRLAGVMRSAGRVLRVPLRQIQMLMAQDTALSDFVLRTFLERRANLLRKGAGLTLVGSRYDPRCRALLQSFSRNRTAVHWLDLEEQPEAEALLQELRVPVTDLPIVLVPGRPMLRNPQPADIAAEFGEPPTEVDDDDRDVCDLLVVGGGPGGLAAAVYGASEGLQTALLDAAAFGGQAGTSSRIENYLGFPAGLSGAELAARGTVQAAKFGVRLHRNARAVAFAARTGRHQVTCDDGRVFSGRDVIIATGAEYRRLAVPGAEAWEGSGVHYAATVAEAQSCLGHPVAVIGGANSAGQAAMFLSRTSDPVHLLVRGQDLEHSMSRYLLDAVVANPKIRVWLRTEAVSLDAGSAVTALDVVDRPTGRRSRLEVGAVFVFIGATPCTGWLGGRLATDRDGFLLTGHDLADTWKADRAPLSFETSEPGVFCVGDARSGSVKRVATAVGEGSAAVRLIFERRRLDGDRHLFL
ncbi:FAD-dependent oxidoreductase [Streptomyces sp. NBC_00056]|uniref:FAD-dependent oxidoreductase n=1 Tax=unclassified Streptomyces TaxID=2593676 RepID=UPI002252B1CE|nr:MULTISPECIES: FAD-dependent oxidoreductase [unclassified Streptomyces]MCX5442727.1 FAD-dependent oxidoreductase [Streptomyces sp. NBC_00063]WUB91086.1 FAD-dependent oxidoreductase [Streptomyces sp. NBC_00569]